ncbi:NAD-dependent epimerase/dehydratase family protein [Patescibacteria group bacterium]|nr:NAD-dependent epimerase/dehydratase family protein [Patescibacteria group bacterium]MBP9709696.1 NAD-dependent epimerase/dehydratase family protein [Patescibacteria group bacterium]
MYIVTGGSGFFGQYLIQVLRSHGCAVKSLDVLPPSERCEGVDYVNVDVRSEEALRAHFQAGDIVIHNAALVPLAHDPKGFWDVNVEGTRNVLSVALEKGVKKVVFISSSSVYGIPVGSEGITEETPQAPFEPYGRSKAEAERICQTYKDRLDVSIVRPRTILGPGRMGLLSLLFEWVKAGTPIAILGNGKNRYQLISGKELAEVVWLVSSEPCKGEDFNAGTSQFGILESDLRTFLRRVQSSSKILKIPGWFARVSLPILRILRLVPFASYQYHVADKDVWFRTDKLKQWFNFVPSESNADVLVETYEWYRQELHDIQGSIHHRPLRKGILVAWKYLTCWL